MAARALTAAVAGRRVARQTGPPLLASCRNHSASAQREEEERKDDHGAAAAAAAAAMPTGEQVEAALNSKNVEVLEGEEHVATVLPDEAIELDVGAGEDASWVPDQETGIFVPADADTHGGGGEYPAAATHLYGGATTATAGGSVLDQTVFVREEDMEDVERPAMADDTDSTNN